MKSNLPTTIWSIVAFLALLLLFTHNVSAKDISSRHSKKKKSSHKPTHEKVIFLNFSDKPLPLYWVDPDEGPQHVVDVLPYEPYKEKTMSGHTFQYTISEETTNYTVESTSKQSQEMYLEEADRELIPQVYVLGSQLKEDPEFASKRVVCETTKGDIRMDIHPFWSPLGAARFLELVHAETRYFDGCALNRVVPNFLTQFGIGEDFEQRTFYREETIPDDPVWVPPIAFEPGFLSFAGSGDHSRSNEIFIVMPNTPKGQLEYFGKNQWETPFGFVLKEDLEVVGSFHSYGDMPPWGKGPEPHKIYEEGGYDTYLAQDFPDLDYMVGCAIVPDDKLRDEAFMALPYKEIAKIVLGEQEEL